MPPANVARVLPVRIAANLVPPPEAGERIRTGTLPVPCVNEDEVNGDEGMSDRLSGYSRASSTDMGR